MEYLARNFDLIVLIVGFVVAVICSFLGIFCCKCPRLEAWGFFDTIINLILGFSVGVVFSALILKLLLFAFAGQSFS